VPLWVNVHDRAILLLCRKELCGHHEVEHHEVSAIPAWKGCGDAYGLGGCSKAMWRLRLLTRQAGACGLLTSQRSRSKATRRLRLRLLPTIEHAEIPNVGLKSFQHWLIYPYDHVVTADLITTASAKQRAAASNHRTLAVPPPFSGGSGMSVLAAVCKGCSRRSKDTMSRIVSCANPVWLLQAFAARRACLGQSVFAECARPAYMGRGVLYALEILANTLHLDRAGDGATGEGHLLSRARGVSGVLLAPQTVLPTRRASF